MNIRKLIVSAEECAKYTCPNICYCAKCPSKHDEESCVASTLESRPDMAKAILDVRTFAYECGRNDMLNVFKEILNQNRCSVKNEMLDLVDNWLNTDVKLWDCKDDESELNRMMSYLASVCEAHAPSGFSEVDEAVLVTVNSIYDNMNNYYKNTEEQKNV